MASLLVNYWGWACPRRAPPAGDCTRSFLDCAAAAGLQAVETP